MRNIIKIYINYYRDLANIAPRIITFFFILAGYIFLCRIAKLTLQYCLTGGQQTPRQVNLF